MEYIFGVVSHQICLWAQMQEGSPDPNIKVVDLFE